MIVLKFKSWSAISTNLWGEINGIDSNHHIRYRKISMDNYILRSSKFPFFKISRFTSWNSAQICSKHFRTWIISKFWKPIDIRWEINVYLKKLLFFETLQNRPVSSKSLLFKSKHSPNSPLHDAYQNFESNEAIDVKQ